MFHRNKELKNSEKESYVVEMGESALGNISRIENIIEKISTFFKLVEEKTF